MPTQRLDGEQVFITWLSICELEIFEMQIIAACMRLVLWGSGLHVWTVLGEVQEKTGEIVQRWTVIRMISWIKKERWCKGKMQRTNFNKVWALMLVDKTCSVRRTRNHERRLTLLSIPFLVLRTRAVACLVIRTGIEKRLWKCCNSDWLTILTSQFLYGILSFSSLSRVRASKIYFIYLDKAKSVRKE